MHLIGLWIKGFVWLVILIAFLGNFLTHFVLWTEWRRAAPAARQAHANIFTRYPWVKLIKSFFIEFGCILLNILLYPLRFLSKQQKQMQAFRDPSAIPVLFVHGYLHNQMAWFWFNRRLRKNPAIGALYTINLFPFFSSIKGLAKQLKDKINDIQMETGSSQVILIGHSMGGIICSYFCEYLAKSREVAMVITLGSPFKGTRMAAFGFGKNIKEMRSASPLLTKLRERIKLSKVPYCSIASKSDNIIIPWYSALLPGGKTATKTQLILENYGHLQLLFSSLIINQVAAWIATNTSPSE